MLSLVACSQAFAKNEYLGGNWRNCEAGHIEPYLQYSTDDYDYAITDSGNEYEREGWDLGVRLRFKFGHTCNKEFRQKQSDRYEFIYPYVQYSRLLNDENNMMNISYDLTTYQKKYDTDVYEGSLINNLNFNSNPLISLKGLKNIQVTFL